MLLKANRVWVSAACLWLFCLACNSPETQVADLQHEFLQQFGSRESFEVRLSRQRLYLPLPAVLPNGKKADTSLEGLLQKAERIPAAKLDPARRSQLELLRAALKEVLAQKGGSFFDPTRYLVLEALQGCDSDGDLNLLLEKIPEYYRQVEERWQAPQSKLAEKAVEECQAVLDFLDRNSEKADPAKVQVARASIKDYIGMCRSAWLE